MHVKGQGYQCARFQGANWVSRGFTGEKLGLQNTYLSDLLGENAACFSYLQHPLEIVGVVANVRERLHAPAPPIAYRAHSNCVGWGAVSLVLRTDARSADIGTAIKAALRDLDRTMPVSKAVSASDLVWASQSRLRFRTVWMSIMAALAITFALIDLTGLVMEYRRRRLRVVAGVCGAGITLALLTTWLLGQANWPTPLRLVSIHLPTASVLMLLLTGAVTVLITAACWYARTLPALPVQLRSR